MSAIEANQMFSISERHCHDISLSFCSRHLNCFFLFNGFLLLKFKISKFKMSGLLSLLSRTNARVCFTPRRMPLSARLLSTLPNTHIFRALQSHDPESLAVVHSISARSFTYGNLIADTVLAKEDLEQKAQGQLAGERIAFIAESSYDYVGTCCLESR